MLTASVKKSGINLYKLSAITITSVTQNSFRVLNNSYTNLVNYSYKRFLGLTPAGWSVFFYVFQMVSITWCFFFWFCSAVSGVYGSCLVQL